MANEASLEGSLQRITTLGLEVLARASRRRVDWTKVDVSRTSAARDQDVHPKAETNLNDAFATISECMARTSRQCQRFYESDCCAEPTDAERKHVSRFHPQPRAAATHQAHVKKDKSSLPEESEAEAHQDFYVDVVPGSYAVTASVVESQEHTQVVDVEAGESVNITFTFPP